MDSFRVESRTSIPSRPLRNSGPLAATSQLTVQALKRGDMLHQGRYRLVEQIALPKNQQGQGTAWLAIDTQSAQSRVVIRQ